MTSLILATPDQMVKQANEIRRMRNQHDEALAKLRRLVLTLHEVWKGEAQEAFVAKYEGMQATFTKFSEVLDEYAELVDLAASTMQETDQNMRTTIQNIG